MRSVHARCRINSRCGRCGRWGGFSEGGGARRAAVPPRGQGLLGLLARAPPGLPGLGKGGGTRPHRGDCCSSMLLLISWRMEMDGGAFGCPGCLLGW